MRSGRGPQRQWRRKPSEMRRYRFGVVSSHVIQYYGPLFRRLASHPAIDLTVLYCSPRGAEPYLDHDLGVRLKWDLPLLDGYRYEFLRNLAPTDKGFFRLVNPGVFRALRRREFDGVLVNGWGTFTMWLAYVTCLVLRIPYFVYGDNVFVIERGGLAAWVRRQLLGWLFSRAGGFLLQGTMNGDFYARYGADRRKFFLMPYAIDNERFHQASRLTADERRQRRADLGIAEDRVVLLFSGKLIARKNPLHLLQAVERMRNRSRVAVLFMGDGRERDALETYARTHGLESVHFVGFVNQSEMPSCYALADVLVLPSSLDPRGTVTNEAMACGLPVVISTMVGIYGEGDIVRHGENGFVYPVGDNDSLAAFLDCLVEDEPLRLRMGQRSWEIIRDWDFEHDVEGVLRALESVTSPEAKPGVAAGAHG
jgi:glycosyltransferase involved in cell wall biosynthesis